MRALVDRDWAAWGGLWAIGGSGVVWAAAGIETRGWQGDGSPVAVDDIAATDAASQAAIVLGVALPVLFAIIALNWRWAPLVARIGLAVGGVGLLVAAWAWTGVVDAGPGYVAASVTGGVLALLGAVRGVRPGPFRYSWARRIAALALLVAGILLTWVSLEGLAYWDWDVLYSGDTVGFALAAVLGVVLALLALFWRALPGRSGAVAFLVGLVLLLAGAATLLWSWQWFTSNGMLHYWEQTESAFSYGTPSLAAATGLVAGAIAAWARRWTLVAWSLAAGIVLGLGALVNESTIQNLI